MQRVEGKVVAGVGDRPGDRVRPGIERGDWRETAVTNYMNAGVADSNRVDQEAEKRSWQWYFLV